MFYSISDLWTYSVLLLWLAWKRQYQSCSSPHIGTLLHLLSLYYGSSVHHYPKWWCDQWPVGNIWEAKFTQHNGEKLKHLAISSCSCTIQPCRFTVIYIRDNTVSKLLHSGRFVSADQEIRPVGSHYLTTLVFDHQFWCKSNVNYDLQHS